MRVGAENRNKVIAAAVLMLLAVVLFARMVLVDSGPSASSPPPSVESASNPRGTTSVSRRLSSRSKSAANGKKQAAPAVSLDPRLRLDLLRSSEEVTYAGTGRNIFLAQEEVAIPQPVATGKAPTPLPPPGPPPPAPIDLKFFGFASRSGEHRRVFLSQGEDVFIAGEGDIVNRRYKLVRINPGSVDVEDVLNPTRHQSIPLTQNPQGR